MAIWRALVLAGVVALTAGPAWGLGQDLDKLKGGGSGGGSTARAPEISTAGLGAVAALLVGGTFLVGTRVARRRRDKRAGVADQAQ